MLSLLRNLVNQIFKFFIIRKYAFYHVLICLLVLVFASPFIKADDGDNLWFGPNGVPVIVKDKHQQFYNMITDEKGGAIIVWTDETDPNLSTWTSILYAQHIDQNGNKLWNPPDGIQVSSSAKSKTPMITSDGEGGVIIAWNCEKSGAHKIYAQRLDAKGIHKWWMAGPWTDVEISSPLPSEMNPVICSDNAGGAYIGFRTRLAHIDAQGKLTSPGIDGIDLIPSLSGTVVDNTIFKIVNVGKYQMFGETHPSGVYATWYDLTKGEIMAHYIYGGLAWGSSGKLVSNQFSGPSFDLVPDGQMGVIVTWTGTAGAISGHTQLRAQRLDRDGNSVWATNGVVIVDSKTIGAPPSCPCITTDGKGGAIIAWQDSRNQNIANVFEDVFAQRIDANGQLLWTSNGVLLPPGIVGLAAPGAQIEAKIVSDGVGGAIVTYQDKWAWGWDVSATRLNSDGVKLWSKYVKADYGTTLNNPGPDQIWPQVVFDASGSAPFGAIISWLHGTAPGNYDIYAQKVEIK